MWIPRSATPSLPSSSLQTGKSSMDAPLRPPSAGIYPNFANPPFIGTPVLVTAGICLPLVLIFAALRFYAKAVILKTRKLDDYVYYISLPVGIAMIALEISIVSTGANGHHAYDVKNKDMTMSATIHVLIFSIALGPVLWLLKLTLFCLILTAFEPVRWLKNCAYIGIIWTGLFCTIYTIISIVACGPEGTTDAVGYLAGINRAECSSPRRSNAIASIFMGANNFASDIYLFLLPIPSVRGLTLPRKEKIGVYVIFGAGSLMCFCSLLGLIFRVRAWQSTDFTSTNIQLYVIFTLELSIGLIIPCMPCVMSVYRHFITPDINAPPFIPSRKSSSLSGLISPKSEGRATWVKTHGSVEELPYRKRSSEFSRTHSPDDLRMKALPATPMPVHASLAPPPDIKSPISPISPRSMRLPIMIDASAAPPI